MNATNSLQNLYDSASALLVPVTQSELFHPIAGVVEAVTPYLANISSLFGGALVAKGLFEAVQMKPNKLKALVALGAGVTMIASGYSHIVAQNELSQFALQTMKVFTVALALSPWFISSPTVDKTSNVSVNASGRRWLAKEYLDRADTAAALSGLCFLSVLAYSIFSLKTDGEQFIQSHKVVLNPDVTPFSVYGLTDPFKSHVWNVVSDQLDDLKSARSAHSSLIGNLFVKALGGALVVGIPVARVEGFKEQAKRYQRLAVG